MELFAIICGGACLFLGLLFFSEGHMSESKKWILVAIIFQFLWFPQVFDERIETETHITNKSGRYVFEKPVKIIKIKKYKPLSALSTETTYEIKFLED